jgi:pimeloyl-ACP methyl ester carboxylesterase
MADNHSQPSFLELKDSNRLAYFHTTGNIKVPAILFLGGFMSDMNGTKAIALEQFCKAKGYSYMRFDYFGHGQSTGTFTQGTIGTWKNNVLTMIDHLGNQPVIIVGSSMGAWLMFLAAQERKQKIAALIGIASAPDFTENLIWDLMNEDERQQLLENGLFEQHSPYNQNPYPISKTLIEEGRNHLILPSDIAISCPVRLLHGMKDDDVPYNLSISLVQKIQSQDVQLQLIKDSDHRMSSDSDIRLITHVIKNCVENSVLQSS